jgi:hypothetical protein
VERSKAELRDEPVGKCGIFCGSCRLYVVTKCKGCVDPFAQRATACKLYKCAEGKGLNSCGKCKDFPCLEHFGSAQVYAKKKLLDWKRQEITSWVKEKTKD